MARRRHTPLSIGLHPSRLGKCAFMCRVRRCNGAHAHGRGRTGLMPMRARIQGTPGVRYIMGPVPQWIIVLG